MTTQGHPRNETLRVLFERASCRNFSEKPVPPDVLRQVLEAGVHAPTGGNLQPYSIIKIEDDDTRTELARLCGEQSFMAKAPVHLLFCIDWHRLRRWAKLEVAPYTSTSAYRNFWISLQDVVLCAQNIATAADSLGMSSVYIGMVYECLYELREMFALPDGVYPVVLLCLGYPARSLQPARKLGVDVVVHEGKYHELSDEQLVEAFNEKYANRQRQINDERLKKVFDVCSEVHGEKFANRCIDRIKENGYISAAQTYFALHYCANTLPLGNEKFLKTMEDFGFDWFKDFKPTGQEP